MLVYSMRINMNIVHINEAAQETVNNAAKTSIISKNLSEEAQRQIVRTELSSNSPVTC